MEVLGPLLFLVLFIELYLLIRWNRTYFRYSIPLLVREIPVPMSFSSHGAVNDLNTISDKRLRGNLIFEQSTNSEVLFRYRMFAWGVPTIHGVVEIDKNKGTIITAVKFNLFYLLFFAILIYGFHSAIKELIVLSIIIFIAYYIPLRHISLLWKVYLSNQRIT